LDGLLQLAVLLLEAYLHTLDVLQLLLHHVPVPARADTTMNTPGVVVVQRCGVTTSGR
jgi:hypothetical protein